KQATFEQKSTEPNRPSSATFDAVPARSDELRRAAEQRRDDKCVADEGHACQQRCDLEDDDHPRHEGLMWWSYQRQNDDAWQQCAEWHQGVDGHAEHIHDGPPSLSQTSSGRLLQPVLGCGAL